MWRAAVAGRLVDVRDEGGLAAALDAAATTLGGDGGIDVMCNNAGIATPLMEDIDRAVAINLTAVLKGTKLAKERMPRGGVIVNTASVAGLGPVDFSPVYAATKAGVVNFTRSLGWLADADGIRVVAICPNFTDTAMVRTSLDDPSFAAVVAAQPGGLLTPDRVAAALALALDDATLAGVTILVTASRGARVVPLARGGATSLPPPKL